MHVVKTLGLGLTHLHGPLLVWFEKCLVSRCHHLEGDDRRKLLSAHVHGREDALAGVVLREARVRLRHLVGNHVAKNVRGGIAVLSHTHPALLLP